MQNEVVVAERVGPGNNNKTLWQQPGAVRDYYCVCDVSRAVGGRAPRGGRGEGGRSEGAGFIQGWQVVWSLVFEKRVYVFFVLPPP